MNHYVGIQTHKKSNVYHLLANILLYFCNIVIDYKLVSLYYINMFSSDVRLAN